mmetsp:Transcript_4804/g.15029  ORF Transcript_4804/g.15029 Transcript_4804/m.15029 type:complete len:234 (-) Transcript_4804:362-1063(-)
MPAARFLRASSSAAEEGTFLCRRRRREMMSPLSSLPYSPPQSSRRIWAWTEWTRTVATTATAAQRATSQRGDWRMPLTKFSKKDSVTSSMARAATRRSGRRTTSPAVQAAAKKSQDKSKRVHRKYTQSCSSTAHAADSKATHAPDLRFMGAMRWPHSASRRFSALRRSRGTQRPERGSSGSVTAAMNGFHVQRMSGNHSASVETAIAWNVSAARNHPSFATKYSRNSDEYGRT